MNVTMRTAGKPGRPKGLPKTGGGSRKGKQNLATVEFKAAVTNLLNYAAPQMVEWLQSVADGNAAHDIKPAPDKALDLTAKLAEFAAPKLARTEHAGDKDAPINIEFSWRQPSK